MWLLAGWRIGEKSVRIYAFALLLMIVVSLSRTTFVACLVLMPFMIWFRPRNISGWIRPIASLALLGAIAVVAIVEIPVLHKRFFGAGDQAVTVNGETLNTSGRIAIWLHIYQRGIQQPYLGHGPGSSATLVREFTQGAIPEPHNDYLRLFYDYGLVGLFLWLWLIFRIVRTLRRGYKLAERFGNLEAQRCIVSALGVLAIVSLVMVTDNVIVYPQQMLLAAALVGVGLGSSFSLQAAAAPRFRRP
jgi:O-antigen ligase